MLALWCRIFYFFVYFFSSLNLDWVAVFSLEGWLDFPDKKNLIFNRSINQHLFILHVKQCVETIIILAEFHSFLALVSQLECLQETFVVIVINFFVKFFHSILSSLRIPLQLSRGFCFRVCLVNHLVEGSFLVT